MPFAFAHPIFALPFKYVKPKYFSVTGFSSSRNLIGVLVVSPITGTCLGIVFASIINRKDKIAS